MTASRQAGEEGADSSIGVVCAKLTPAQEGTATARVTQ